MGGREGRGHAPNEAANGSKIETLSYGSGAPRAAPHCVRRAAHA